MGNPITDGEGVSGTELDRRFIVVGGKGGVGRTTVAAALALILARRGRRVLLAHVRSRQRVDRLLGCRRVDHKIRQVEPNLWAVNMNPRAALKERGLMVLRLQVIYKAVMENRLVKHFLRAIPSLDEYSMLGKAWFHTTEEIEKGDPRFHTVIFDGPATGHLLTMLRIPQVILDTVPDGPLTTDAYTIRDLLVDPQRTGLWIVTLAEEIPVTEAEDLLHAAREKLKIHPQRLVVNALYPEALVQDPEISKGLDLLLRGAGDPALTPLVSSALTLRSRRQINETYLARLAETVQLPTTRLPYLFEPELDREALEKLAEVLEGSLNLEPETRNQEPGMG